ncbi:MAG: glycosyltransferase family 4 protein [Flavobacteriales bacterium]|nr:glycosyltransferase family 4 protein [Flavobacteriales bacterium]
MGAIGMGNDIGPIGTGATMSKPQVIVFVDWYKPGYKGGGPVRSMMNLVDHIGDHVDLWFVTSDTDYTADAPYPGIVPDIWTPLPSGEMVWYASAKGRSRANWAKLLAERKWDAVYINGMFSWWYSIMPLAVLRGTTQRRIVAARGMLLPGPMGQGGLKKRTFLTLARAAGLYRGVEFQSTSADETLSIQHWIGKSPPIHLVPNLPRKLEATTRPARTKQPGSVRLVNVVRIATEKNIHLIIESLHGLRGEVTFDLFGPVHHVDYWAMCQLAIAQLPPNVHFAYYGPLPSEAVPATLAGNYHALFMPNEGDNFGHTMLEAMCTGLPLLISDRTPWRHLEQQHVGWDLPLNELSAFTRTIQRLIDMDQTEFDQWSEGAFQYGRRQAEDPNAVALNLHLFRA